MTRLCIEIDRLRIILHELSSVAAEEAVAGLGAELRARLARARWSDAVEAPMEIGELSIRDVRAGADAASLRTIIAERLAEGIVRVASAEKEQAS